MEVHRELRIIDYEERKELYRMTVLQDDRRRDNYKLINYELRITNSRKKTATQEQ